MTASIACRIDEFASFLALPALRTPIFGLSLLRRSGNGRSGPIVSASVSEAIGRASIADKFLGLEARRIRLSVAKPTTLVVINS
jgi:hypothetical protein